MSSKKRQKLSDLYAEPGPFVRVVSFEEKYPTIKGLEVWIDESGDGIYEGYSKRTLGKESYRAIFDCSNPICYGGGIYLDRVLDDMVRNDKREFRDIIRCMGYEGSPKGKRKYRSCANNFNIEIRISNRE